MADNLLKAQNESTASLNFTHSSRQAWDLGRKLGPELPKPGQYSTISANNVAVRLIRVAKAKMHKIQKPTMKRNYEVRKKEMKH
ncbi:Hypothetical protein CINCED_3A017649 [Cinara cedri]|uniref:Uncharacterized protein n=1 Tax=Cinara cedri TaxID=506608 RepID=A0A5E4NMG3_9HEMI|nr:Hypothetical protein CINCED_3A017649 [Cinara cedri]